MDLQQFVAQTLASITLGIVDAQEYLKGHRNRGVIINPRIADKGKNVKSAHGLGGDGSGTPRPIQMVEFDVAVTVSEHDKTAGGGAVTVLGIGLGAKGEMAHAQGSESRVKFCVSLLYPVRSESKK